MSKLVDVTGPATYRMLATVFTDVVGDDEKWYQPRGLSRCFRSDKEYPTVSAATGDHEALDIPELAESVREALTTVIDKVGGFPRIKITLELFPCKCPPQALLGVKKKTGDAT